MPKCPEAVWSRHRTKAEPLLQHLQGKKKLYILTASAAGAFLLDVHRPRFPELHENPAKVLISKL